MNFRQLLLLITGIGILLTAGLDAWVRTLPSVEASTHFKMTITLERKDQSDKVQKLLIGLKIPVNVKPRYGKKGFRVVYANSTDLVQAIFKQLKQNNERVSVVQTKAASEPGLTNDTAEVQYGGNFPTRAAAQAAVRHLAGKAYVFKVVENTRQVQGNILEVPALGTPDLELCKQGFKDLKIPDTSFVLDHSQ